MKLRLHRNEIRVRLNRNEVAEFAEAGRVEDAVDFGEGAILTYVLETSPNGTVPNASWRGGVVRVQLPAQDAQHWARTDRVAISGEQTVGWPTVFSSWWRRIFNACTIRAMPIRMHFRIR